MTLTEAALRTLDDLHKEFCRASADIGPKEMGYKLSADARAELLRTYSLAVERVLNAAPTVSTTKTVRIG